MAAFRHFTGYLRRIDKGITLVNPNRISRESIAKKLLVWLEKRLLSITRSLATARKLTQFVLNS